MFLFRRLLFGLGKQSSTNKPFKLNINRTSCICNNFRRNLCITSTLNAKMFTEYENNYAFDIISSNQYIKASVSNNHKNLRLEVSEYEITQHNLEQFIKEDWSRKTPSEVFLGFHRLTKYCSQNNICISNERFDNFIDCLTSIVKDSSDVELIELCGSLCEWPATESVRTRNFIEVWAAIDDACLSRYRNWTMDELLLFASLMYKLSIVRAGDFMSKCVQKLTNKCSQLTPQQLVQTMFYVGLLRRPPFDMHNLEVHLQKKLEHFTVDDLAVMAMGFFKSKTPIRDITIVESMIEKIIKDADNINEVSLAALLKIIRYSMKLDPNCAVDKLLEALEKQVHRLSVMCCVHVALAGTVTLTFHEACLSKVAETVIRNIKNARIKDLERLTFTFVAFNFKPKLKECFFTKVIEELKNPAREEEINIYGKSFACCVSFLTMIEHYPLDLISKVLDPTFLQQSYGKNTYFYGREILTLHNVIDIFCKDYKGHVLNAKLVQSLSKKYTDYVPDVNFKKQFNYTEQLFLDVINTLRKQRGGDHYVSGDHILTHYQRGDIILCDDKNGNPYEISDYFPAKEFGPVHRPPNENYWIVLIIAGRNAFIKNSEEPTGPFVKKLRELQALGFYPNIVSSKIWSELNNHHEKCAYLNSLLDSALPM